MFRIKSMETELERRRKISVSVKGRGGGASTPEKEIERRRKLSEKAKKRQGYSLGACQTGIPHTDEWKKQISEKIKLAHQRKQFGWYKGCSCFWKGKTKESGCLRASAISRAMKGRKPSDERLKRWFKSCMQKPNRLEKRFIEFCVKNNLPYKYVGNGKLIIDGRCPDFINTNGEKKIIELFGDYWHRNDYPNHRIEHYAKFGFKALVIWESELKNEELVLQRMLLWK